MPWASKYRVASANRLQLHSFALEGADATVWDWNVRRDEIAVSADLEEALGMEAGALNLSSEEWLAFVHPTDRERIRLMLWSIREHKGGDLKTELRLRRADGSYLWCELKAQCVADNQPKSLRCIGLMRDVTGERRSQERLLHDAVHDSLTGLPNRELFLDRLSGAVTRARLREGGRPTVFFVDIDRFKNVNRSLGLTLGDTMLLTVAIAMCERLQGRKLRKYLGALVLLVAVIIVSDFARKLFAPS